MLAARSVAAHPDSPEPAEGGIRLIRASRPASRPESRRSLGTLRTLLSWCRDHFDLFAGLPAVPDGRQASRIRIPLPAILLTVLFMFWLDLPSIRALASRIRRRYGASWARLGGKTASRTAPPGRPPRMVDARIAGASSLFVFVAITRNLG